MSFSCTLYGLNTHKHNIMYAQLNQALFISPTPTQYMCISMLLRCSLRPFLECELSGPVVHIGVSVKVMYTCINNVLPTNFRVQQWNPSERALWKWPENSVHIQYRCGRDKSV